MQELPVGVHIASLVHQKSFENPFPVYISIYADIHFQYANVTEMVEKKKNVSAHALL